MKFCEDKYELERKTQLIFISIIYSYTPLSQTYEHKKKNGDEIFENWTYFNSYRLSKTRVRS